MFARSLAKVTERRSEIASPLVISVVSIEPASAASYSGPARQTTIQALTTGPPDGRELVRIIGRYRGRNWFGDMPSDSRRSHEDWVVKDGPFALWVTGSRPEGDGFTLGASNVRDTQAWLAVTGTIEERKGIVYLKARRVELSPAPDSAGQTPPLFKTGKAPVPPQIAFLAPVAGVEPAAPDQQFLLRFTKPMDESTFRDRVHVRYADAPETNLPRTSVTYYPERMFSIMVDPGQALQPGRTIEVVLLPGIKDADGLPLTTADEAQVLKWTVATGQ
jgi:hypothetical protein